MSLLSLVTHRGVLHLVTFFSFAVHYTTFFCISRVYSVPWFSHRTAPTISGGQFISVNCSFFYIERCHFPVLLLLLLRRAFLVRHGGVCSLQSVREGQSEAASYRTEKGDTTTGHGCWLWPDGRKRTDLHLSGNVQAHAGTAEI